MQTIRTMIVPAAGFGTRMQSLTGKSSKEIIDVCGRPALAYVLAEAVEAQIQQVGIVIRKGKEDILEALHDDSRLASIGSRIDIHFFYQAEPTGEAGAIHTAAAWIGGDPFVVHYPDNIIVAPPGALSHLIARYKSIGTDLVLLTAILAHAQTPPCSLETIGGGVYRMAYDIRPDAFPHGLRPTGVYIASRHFLAACGQLLASNRSGEVKDRDIRSFLAKQGHPVHAVDLGARVMDVGNPDGYQAANAMLAAMPTPQP